MQHLLIHTMTLSMASVGSLAMTLLVMTLAAHVAPSDLLMPGVRSRPRKDIPIFFPDPPQLDPARPRPQGHLTPISQPQPQPKPIPGDEDLDLHPVDIDKMSESNLQRFNSLTNISEFVDFFNLKLPKEEEFSSPSGGLTTCFGDAAATVKKVEVAIHANCKPELVTVPLNLPAEVNTRYFPMCVRLEQCGGCCSGTHNICRPTITEVYKFKVLRTITNDYTDTRRGLQQSSGSGSRRRRQRRHTSTNYRMVELTKHIACKCQCRVQESDCDNRIHDYFKRGCACVCKKSHENRRCKLQHSKYWDNASCSCYCHDPHKCSTGQYFSHETCRCVFLPVDE